MSDLDARVRAIVRDLTQAVVPDDGDVRFTELPGWDSVTHLHLLLDVERQFEIEIPDAVGMSLDSASKLHDYIAARRPDLAGGGG